MARPNDWKPPEYDFGFFGSLSNRRLKILKRPDGNGPAEAESPVMPARRSALTCSLVIIRSLGGLTCARSAMAFTRPWAVNAWRAACTSRSW